MRGTTNIPEVAVIIRKGKKILFVLRQNTGWSDGMYCLPGGHVEDGEKFSAAAVREAHEEVNLTVEALKPVHITQRISTSSDVRFGLFFEVTTWSGTPENMEPERHAELIWFDENDLPFHNIVQFQADVLQAIRQGKMYSELGW
jgi:8-oxo-dGTP diphosphatase